MTVALDKQAHDTAKQLDETAERIHDEIDQLARLLAKMRGLCFVTPSELDKIERLRQAAHRVDLLSAIGSIRMHSPEAHDAIEELSKEVKV